MLTAERAIADYDWLVRTRACLIHARIGGRGIDIDDLLQTGRLALLESLGRYNAQSDCSFATYAGMRIHGAMLDWLRLHDWIPRSARRGQRDIDRVTQQLQDHLQRPPTASEIAAALDITLAAYHHLRLDISNGILDSYDEEGDDEQFPSRVAAAAKSLPNDADAAHAAAQTQALKTLSNRLPWREQRVLHLYYRREWRLHEIGDQMGISESRVCQLRRQAVDRLRRLCHGRRRCA